MNQKYIQLHGIIDAEFAGLRLDQALAKLFPEYSRGQLQTWIQENQVKVDGKVQTNQRSKTILGQAIDVDALLVAKERYIAQSIPLDVVYEDEAILVINKQAGLTVHPGAGTPDTTLVNALLHYAPELDHLPRAGIIHRLDKDTSGLLVIARTLMAHHALTQAMKRREIHRQYIAIVKGVIIAGGTIDANIGRHNIHRTRMAVTPSGRTAITHYRVLKRFRLHTELEVTLETGRTHQIRVHMAHIHHPLVGDPVYGSHVIIPTTASAPLKSALQDFHRQALHAVKLGLPHPITEEWMEWQAPLPEDLQNLLTELDRDSHDHSTLY